MKIYRCLSLLGPRASDAMHVIFALNGPPTIRSPRLTTPTPNASGYALCLNWHMQRRELVSRESAQLLRTQRRDDSILKDPACKTHIMCERSVAQLLPDLSDLSDSNDGSSSAGETPAGTAFAARSLMQPGLP
jgi:hypothetical protein